MKHLYVHLVLNVLREMLLVKHQEIDPFQEGLAIKRFHSTPKPGSVVKANLSS